MVSNKSFICYIAITMPIEKHSKVILIIFVLVATFFVVWLGLKYVNTFKSTESIETGTRIDKNTPEDEILELGKFKYIEIINGCGPYYDTDVCVNVRSGPGIEYPVVGRLRTGVVLRVEIDTIKDDLFSKENPRTWYKVILDEYLLYPERVTGGWYVAVDSTSIREFMDEGDSMLEPNTETSTTKRIVVDLSDATLHAYDGDDLFMQAPISTGLELTPTPRGVFSVFKKTPSRYMQGPLPGLNDEQVYDLPGVPWDLYFTEGGAVIHGAYWHDRFGEKWSHGCVNLSSQEAQKLYKWAELGTSVTVRD